MFNQFEQAGVSVPIKLKFLWTNQFSAHRVDAKNKNFLPKLNNLIDS